MVDSLLLYPEIFSVLLPYLGPESLLLNCCKVVVVIFTRSFRSVTKLLSVSAAQITSVSGVSLLLYCTQSNPETLWKMKNHRQVHCSIFYVKKKNL